MISVSSSFKSPASLFVQPPQRSALKKLKKIGNQELIRISRGKGLSCRSELAQDAPFAAAIGACVLTSLVFPISYDDDENGGGGGAIDSTDARFAVMGIISFIPYFNWMSWVFAWLDSDDSWLPIASIVICIIHIQLEASIKNGDINGIQFFGRALKLFSSFKEEGAKFQPREEIPNKGRNKKQMDPPSAGNVGDGFELGESETPRKHVDDPRHLEERSDGDEKENKID